MQGLGFLPGASDSDAYGVSNGGAIAVGNSGGDAFIWDADHGIRKLQVVLAQEYGLSLPGWYLQVASDVSADGITILGYGTNPQGQSEAFRVVLPEPGAGIAVVMAVALARRRSCVRFG